MSESRLYFIKCITPFKNVKEGFEYMRKEGDHKFELQTNIKDDKGRLLPQHKSGATVSFTMSFYKRWKSHFVETSKRARE